MESYKKFNVKAQTANFSDLTRQHQELSAENTKTRETKTQISERARELSHDGTLDMCCNIKILSYLPKSKKSQFLSILHVTLQKNSSG